MTDLYVERTTRGGDYRPASGQAASQPGGRLSRLSIPELSEMRQSADSGSAADKAIQAELYRRVYTQSAIDAKAAAILDEERRLASRPGTL